MVLSPKERALIRRLVDRQIQLEQMIANRAHPLAGLGYRFTLEDPFDSPLIISREEKLAIAEDGARRGKKLRNKIKKPRESYFLGSGLSVIMILRPTLPEKHIEKKSRCSPLRGKD